MLHAGTRVEMRRSVWWGRDDQRGLRDGVLGVDSSGLAGGPALIVETIEHYLLFPELREHLGTAASVPRGTS